MGDVIDLDEHRRRRRLSQIDAKMHRAFDEVSPGRWSQWINNQSTRETETMTSKNRLVAVRVPPDLDRRLSEARDYLKQSRPGLAWTGSDVVRVLLEQAIKSLFEERGQQKAGE